MKWRAARPEQVAVAAIYATIVEHTAISFEIEAPSVTEIRSRIADCLLELPWLVSLDESDEVSGYVYASKHRNRAAYQWSVDTTAYVREDCRGRGIARALYRALIEELVRLGYVQAFAGIALPNAASVALHESVGFSPVGVYRKVGYKLGAWRDVGWWQRSLSVPVEVPCTPRPFTGR